MHKGIGALAALQLLVVSALAGQSGIEKLFPAAPTGFVTDVAHLLDRPTTETIEGRLDHLRAVTGGEVAVVTLPTIGDYDAADVARTIARAWKVGPDAPIGDKRRNAGVLILLVPHTSDHGGAIRVEVGQGVEGAIPDAKAGQIRDAMMPDLQQRDYGAALDLGTGMIADIVARDLGVQDTSLLRKPASTTHRLRSSPVPFKVILYAIIFVIWLVSIILRNRGGGGRGGRGGGSGVGWLLPYMIGRSFGGGGGFGGGGFGGGGGGGGGFGGFGGGGGFSGGGAGGSF